MYGELTDNNEVLTLRTSNALLASALREMMSWHLTPEIYGKLGMDSKGSAIAWTTATAAMNNYRNQKQ